MYYRLPQAAESLFSFHVEHVIARQHQGPSAADNLALACHHCNAHKGPNLVGIDPQTESMVPLFHPRHDVWNEHFEFRGAEIIGVSPIGRVTIQVLQLNAPGRVELRAEWLREGTLHS